MTEIKANDQCGDAHRSTNFDLMGISMMMLIIMGHVAMYSGKLSQLGTTDYYITNLRQYRTEKRAKKKSHNPPSVIK